MLRKGKTLHQPTYPSQRDCNYLISLNNNLKKVYNVKGKLSQKEHVNDTWNFQNGQAYSPMNININKY